MTLEGQCFFVSWNDFDRKVVKVLLNRSSVLGSELQLDGKNAEHQSHGTLRSSSSLILSDGKKKGHLVILSGTKLLPGDEMFQKQRDLRRVDELTVT